MNVEAVGRAALDLMRLAKEVTALQRAKVEVVLLYSIPSTIYSAKYLPTLFCCYEALSFCGVPIGFISERQVQDGRLGNYKALIIPGATNVQTATLKGIEAFRRRGSLVIAVGEECLKRDEYNHPHPGPLIHATISKTFLEEQTAKDLWAKFRPELAAADIESPISLIGMNGKPIWGIEWRCIEKDGALLVNLINHLRHTVNVEIVAPKSSAPQYTELISGRAATPHLNLAPMQIALVKITGSTF